jgi:hypothetical protein
MPENGCLQATDRTKGVDNVRKQLGRTKLETTPSRKNAGLSGP